MALKSKIEIDNSACGYSFEQHWYGNFIETFFIMN